jgi:hypothetical protein
MRTYTKRRTLKELEKWGLCAMCNTLTHKFNEGAQLHFCRAACTRKFNERNRKE